MRKEDTRLPLKKRKIKRKKEEAEEEGTRWHATAVT